MHIHNQACIPNKITAEILPLGTYYVLPKSTFLIVITEQNGDLTGLKTPKARREGILQKSCHSPLWVGVPLCSGGAVTHMFLLFKVWNWCSPPLQLRADFERSWPDLLSDLVFLASSVSLRFFWQKSVKWKIIFTSLIPWPSHVRIWWMFQCWLLALTSSVKTGKWQFL